MNGTTVVKIVIHNLLTGERLGISDCGCRISDCAFLRQQAGISDVGLRIWNLGFGILNLEFGIAD